MRPMNNFAVLPVIDAGTTISFLNQTTPSRPLTPWSSQYPGSQKLCHLSGIYAGSYHGFGPFITLSFTTAFPGAFCPDSALLATDLRTGSLTFPYTLIDSKKRIKLVISWRTRGF